MTTTVACYTVIRVNLKKKIGQVIVTLLRLVQLPLHGILYAAVY